MDTMNTNGSAAYRIVRRSDSVRNPSAFRYGEQTVWHITRKSESADRCDSDSQTFLMHYGVPGMKWGVITKTYRQTASGSSKKASSDGGTASGLKSAKKARTPEEIKARRARAKKIIAVSAGIAVAAALGYAAYRGSTNLRDKMRKDILKNMGQGYESVHTLNSKYWNSADRAKYSQLTKERAQHVADNFRRRDALASEFYNRTGIRVSVPQSRERVLADRRSSQKVSNFLRDAEKRGQLNRSIHDTRESLKKARQDLASYQNTARIGTSKQYERMWIDKKTENIEKYQEMLDDLLRLRKAG